VTTELQTYATDQAKHRARVVAFSAGFPSHQIEDLQQELILDLLRRASNFDPSRGELTGFVRGVMWHRGAVLINRRRRLARREILAGDIATPDTEAPEVNVIDAHHHVDPTAGFHMSIDVRRVISNMPTELRLLANLLTELPVRDIAKATGKSRSGIYKQILRIRKEFVRAGLNPYRSGGLAAGRSAEKLEGGA